MPRAPRPKTICLDFDGVLHSYTSPWQGPGIIPDGPVDGAMEFVIQIVRDKRFKLAIHSSRSKYWIGRHRMKQWLRRYLAEHFARHPAQYPELIHGARWTANFVFGAAGLAPQIAADDLMRQIKWPWFKPPAWLTIDDRAIQFTGIWPTKSSLLAFQPWNRKSPHDGAVQSAATQQQFTAVDIARRNATKYDSTVCALAIPPKPSSGTVG